MEIRTIPIKELNHAAYNPRKDLKPKDPAYQKLKRSIMEFGYVDPIVWNERTGNVIGGHQRLKILEEMGKAEVFVSVVDLSEMREKALNLALNKIQGEWDENKLANQLDELKNSSLNISLTGFDLDEIEDLMMQFHIPKNNIEYDENIKTENKCPKCGYEW